VRRSLVCYRTLESSLLRFYIPGPFEMKRRFASLLPLAGALLVVPIFADTITSPNPISLDESQRVWDENFQFVTGMLFLCNGTPVNSLTGPCGGSLASDIIIFNNAKHEVIFLSNSADGSGDPGDVPFTGHLNVINPRFVFPETPVDGADSFVWAPGPKDPGFSGTGKTWTIKTDQPTFANAEPGTLVLLGTVLIVLVKLVRRRLPELGARRSSAH
jgi:hypothetical protein